MSREPSEYAGFKSYFIFGEYADGFVDVVSNERDVATHISRTEAERLIEDREKLKEALDEAIWANQEPS